MSNLSPRLHALLVPLLLMPLALAHDPPAPVPTCQTGGVLEHEYGPPAHGQEGMRNDALAYPDGRLYLDGNQDDCDADGDAPDFDGEPEYSPTGALLLVDTGDGTSWGAAFCLGGVGHHTGTVYAEDVAGFGPSFLVGADHPRPGIPGCPDGIIEWCPPPPVCRCTPLPFPLNVVVDLVNEVLWEIDQTIDHCNPLDQMVEAPADWSGPSSATPLFGPGSDGAYHVLLQQSINAPGPATAGHVWTDP